MRRLHRVMGLMMGVQLFFVGVTGSLLALKDAITTSGVLGTYDPWPLVYDFHRSLFAGWLGKFMVSLLGLGLAGMVWTGFRTYVRRKSRRISIHAALGLGFGIPLGIIAGLGSVLNFVEPLSNWLDPIPVVAGVNGQGNPPTPIEVTVAQVEKAKITANRVKNPDELIRIYSPKQSRPYFIFYYRGNTKLYIDPQDSRLLKIRSPSIHWTSALLPLHALHDLGEIGHGIMVVLGLVLASLTSLAVVHLWRLLMRAMDRLISQSQARFKRVRVG